jgi:hypothetical protein
MRLVVFIILTFVSFETLAQFSDTITGFNSKIEGEEITYFSPRKKFADRALLTRANGKSSISWNAPLYYTEKLEDQDHTSTTYP